MKIVISGKEYPVATQNDATLADFVALKDATGLTRKDLRELGERVSKMTEAEAEDSEDAMLATGVTVWLTRRRAGEHLTLEEACDFPLAQLQFIVEPGDAIAAPAAAGEAPDPTSAAPGDSPRAAARPATSDRLPSKRKTSKRASSSA